MVYLSLPEVRRRRVKTTNPLERFIKELNRKIKEVGVFPPSTLLRVVSLSNHSDRSWDRMTYLIRQPADTTSKAEDTPTPPNTILHTTLDTIGMG